jgi:hypothetical protein
MNYLIRPLLFSALLALLFVCNAEAAVSDIGNIYHEIPTLDAFDICFGGGCAEIRRVSLSSEDWAKVTNIFANQVTEISASAELERKHIASAIGILETIVGAKIGTSADRAGTFGNSSYPNQLDCNDEAINTTTYIHLMQHYALIKLHESEDTRTRNFFLNGWPHSTAVIREIASGQRYAVDSWFYDNGIPATIVPFELWKSGYFPADSPIRHPPKVH